MSESERLANGQRRHEDVYDGGWDPPEMVCNDCGAQYAEWVDPEDPEEWGLTYDDCCPACGSERVERMVLPDGRP